MFVLRHNSVSISFSLSECSADYREDGGEPNGRSVTGVLPLLVQEVRELAVARGNQKVHCGLQIPGGDGGGDVASSGCVYRSRSED